MERTYRDKREVKKRVYRLIKQRFFSYTSKQPDLSKKVDLINLICHYKKKLEPKKYKLDGDIFLALGKMVALLKDGSRAVPLDFRYELESLEQQLDIAV